jgi:hypothetical protein
MEVKNTLISIQPKGERDTLKEQNKNNLEWLLCLIG